MLVGRNRPALAEAAGDQPRVGDANVEEREPHGRGAPFAQGLIVALAAFRVGVTLDFSWVDG